MTEKYGRKLFSILILISATISASFNIAPQAGPYLVSFEPCSLYVRWDDPPWYASDSFADIWVDCDSGLWEYGIPVVQAINYVYYFEYWIPPDNANRCVIISAYIYARPTGTWHLIAGARGSSYPSQKVYLPFIRK